MSLRDDIQAEIAGGRLDDFTDHIHLQMLIGYRNHFGAEWYKGATFNEHPGWKIDRQMAMVLTWAIEQIEPGAGTPYDEDSSRYGG